MPDLPPAVPASADALAPAADLPSLFLASTLQRLLFEDPLLLVGALLLVGVVAGWTAMREGLAQRGVVALVAIVAAAGVFIAARVVETSSERAEASVRAFVEAMEQGDLLAVSRSLHPDAVFNRGQTTNPGFDRDFIMSQASRVLDRYTIESARINTLDGTPDGDGAVEVDLSVSVSAGGMGATPMRWQIRVVEDGSDWTLRRLTWLSVLGGAPPSDGLR